MEHKANFVEEKIEKLEQELMTAKKTMRETHDKNDETCKRLLVKERKLEMALSNAEKSEARVRQLEADLAAGKWENEMAIREVIYLVINIL